MQSCLPKLVTTDARLNVIRSCPVQTVWTKGTLIFVQTVSCMPLTITHAHTDSNKMQISSPPARALRKSWPSCLVHLLIAPQTQYNRSWTFAHAHWQDVAAHPQAWGCPCHIPRLFIQCAAQGPASRAAHTQGSWSTGQWRKWRLKQGRHTWDLVHYWLQHIVLLWCHQGNRGLCLRCFSPGSSDICL